MDVSAGDFLFGGRYPPWRWVARPKSGQVPFYGRWTWLLWCCIFSGASSSQYRLIGAGSLASTQSVGTGHLPHVCAALISDAERSVEHDGLSWW